LTAESILHNNEKYSEQLLRGECGVKLSEIYPVHLPDLFHGSQVVVLGKYHGQGHAVLKLTGEVGNQTREFEYNVKLPEKTDDARSFVEDLWARRKVGYLLDQIRSNGENKELVDEVVSLAKKHGIVTPYTSYLVVPDTAVPVTTPNSTVTGSNLTVPVPGGYAAPGVSNASAPQGLSQKHMQAAFGIHQLPPLAEAPRMAPMHVEVDSTSAGSASAGAKYDQHLFDGQFTQPTFPTSDLQTGKTGVDMALYLNDLRNQNQVTAKANRTANGRNCFNINGVWIDEHFNAKVKTLNVKAQSDAYFRILDKHPEMKSVFQLGNRVVWIAPNGVALIIDPTEGKESLDNDEIDKLFVAAK
jgi:Ca-activated chloride channel family protein